MTLTRLFFCASLLLANQLAFGSTQWPNEPAGAAVFADCPFTGELCPNMFNMYNTKTFANITLPGQQPASPTGILDYYLPVGATSGGGQIGVNVPNVREIYVATWWATNANSSWNGNNGNKILFISGKGNNNLLLWQGSPTGAKRLVWYPQSEQSNCHVSGYEGGCGAPGAANSGWFNPNGTHNGYVDQGSGWHLIEIYKRASTTATSQNGITRIWIDGQLSTNYTNINESPEGFYSMQYNSTWGGFICDSPDMYYWRDCSLERHHYYDHLRVSAPNMDTLVIWGAAIQPAKAGQSFTHPFVALGGKPPYSWTVPVGSLPNGMTLNNSTGVFSGTPLLTGRYDFSVQVSDAGTPAKTARKSINFFVNGTSGIGNSQAKAEGMVIEPKAGSVQFNLPQRGAYTASVHDLLGRKVWGQRGAAGTQSLQWTYGKKIEEGVYLLRLTQGGRSISKGFAIFR